MRINKSNQERYLFHIANSILGSNQIFNLAFNADHDLWVGAGYNGLYLWDGLSWQDHSGYLAGRIISFRPIFCVDSIGNLWISSFIGSSNVLIKYDGSIWTEYTSDDSELPHYTMNDLAAGPNGEIWGISSGFEEYRGTGEYDVGGSFLISVIDGVLHSRDLIQGEPYLNPWMTGDIKSLDVDSEGRVWFSTREYGGSFRMLHEGVWSMLRMDEVLDSAMNIIDFAICDNDEVWVVSQNQLVKLSADLAPTIYQVENYGRDISDLKSVYQDKLTITTTRLPGVQTAYLLFEDGIWSLHNSLTNPLDYAQFIQIEEYAVDLEGNLWIEGYYDQGIFRWDGETWANFNTDNSPLDSNSICSIYADPTGGVWIGTIAHLTRVVGDEWTTYDCEASGLWNPKKIIRSLDNKLHIIDNLSIYTYNIATGYGHVYLSIHNSLLPSNYVQDIAVDQYNRVWIATAGGLVRWHGNNVDVFRQDNSPFDTCNFTALARDGDYLWIATRTGQLARLFVNDFVLQDFSGFGAPPDYIWDLAVDLDHSVWITTVRGQLFRWNNSVLRSTDTPGYALSKSDGTDVLISPDGRKWLNVYNNGIISFTGEIVANDDPVVVPVPQTNLINYPNPFRTSTTISIRTDAAGVYRLQIYNMRGQLVQSKSFEADALSELSWTWDCTDMQGSKLASGLYFAKLGWPGGSYSRKLLLLD